MTTFFKLLRYELLGIARNRWIFVSVVLNAAMAFGLLKLSGDAEKAATALATINTVLVPLTGILFATLYWYFSVSYTELLLTLPVTRGTVFAARAVAIAGTLTVSYVLATALPFVAYRVLPLSLMAHLAAMVVLAMIFTGVGTVVAVTIDDRMRGFGTALSVWLLCAVFYDAGVLLALSLLRDYPMDTASAVLGVLNPIGLARVTQLVTQDAAFLLGHTGALVRGSLTSVEGRVFAVGVAAVWVGAPWLLGYWILRRRDF